MALRAIFSFGVLVLLAACSGSRTQPAHSENRSGGDAGAGVGGEAGSGAGSGAEVAGDGGDGAVARMSHAEGEEMNRHPSPMITHFAPSREDEFGPLEVGADYLTRMTKVNTQPFQSRTHGNRWVNIYVNATGLAAYERGDDLPVGSVVVKESFESNERGTGPDLATRGPVFVMERRPDGYDPARGDYWYAIWIENPHGRTSLYDDGRASPSVYWRGHSPRVQYCEDCHMDYGGRMGGVPRRFQTWGGRDAGGRP